MTHNIYLYILVAALVSTLIRVIPLTLIRGKIQNPFLRSFLYYVPYATLAVMTFPAIITAPQLPIAGILALIVGVVADLARYEYDGDCSALLCRRILYRKCSCEFLLTDQRFFFVIF